MPKQKQQSAKQKDAQKDAILIVRVSTRAQAKRGISLKVQYENMAKEAKKKVTLLSTKQLIKTSIMH